MVDVAEAEPTDVLDRLLWRDAQQMLGRHARPGPDDRCEWCGDGWPCPPRRLAERAAAVSRNARAAPPPRPRPGLGPVNAGPVNAGPVKPKATGGGGTGTATQTSDGEADNSRR